MNLKRRAVLFVLLLFTVLAAAACKENRPPYPERAMPAGLMKDTVQLQSGQKLFVDKCASCHGKASEGRSERAAFFEPAAPDFSGRHYNNLDPAFLYWRIETGKNVEPYLSQGSVMPAWGLHLSETEIWQIVAYLRSRTH